MRTVIDAIRQEKVLGRHVLNEVRFVLFDKDPSIDELFELYKKTVEHYLLDGQTLTEDPIAKRGLIKRFACYIGSLPGWP